MCSDINMATVQLYEWETTLMDSLFSFENTKATIWLPSDSSLLPPSPLPWNHLHAAK
jgi:hypothetical protein